MNANRPQPQLTARRDIVHTEASQGWGGQEIRILTEMAGMQARGHRVTLLCAPEARIYDEAGRRGLPVVGLPIRRKSFAGLRAVVRWLKHHPVDVVNTHSSTDTWLVALAGLFLRRPPALVRTRHVSVPVSNAPTTRWLYRCATRAIVTTGESLRQTLIDDNGVDPQRITSVPTGIDTNAFVPGDQAGVRRTLGLPDAVAIIGIVATLRSWKGHQYLLEAFSLLTDKSAVLVIVGDGPQREALARRVDELGIAGRVIFAGNQRDVIPWLQALDVFALPSYSNEGVPQALLQAMCCGLPVVSTPVGAIPEIVEHGRTGLLVPPRDVNALHDALRGLLADHGMRASLARSARALVQERFSIEIMLDRMERVFAAALAGRGQAEV